MSGMVFPQSPASERAVQASDHRLSMTSDKSEDSTFDSVSRQEQLRAEQKLEARRQARDDREERIADARAQDADVEQSRAKDRQADKADDQVNHEEGQETDSVADASGSARVDEGDEVSQAKDPEQKQDPDMLDVETDATATFTFADLRAMVTTDPAKTRAGGEASQAKTSATPLPPQLPLNGQGAQTGAVSPAGQSDAASGQAMPGQTVASLVEGLAAAGSGDSAKAIDPAAMRLAPVDTLANHAAQTAAGQKVAEQAVALRGYTTSIDLPVGHAEWGDKLVGKLTWLTANNMSSAEIHLTPPDMGPMDVRVHLHRDQAAVIVHSANPVVRDQLELNSHRLRDMLSDQGIDLDRFEVADQGGQSGGQWSSQGDGGTTGGDGGSGSSLATADGLGSEEVMANGGNLDLTWKGEVDLYA